MHHCIIVGNEREKKKNKRFKELKKRITRKKYPKLLIEGSIRKVKKIPLEVLGKPKTPKMRKLFLSLIHTFFQ